MSPKLKSPIIRTHDKFAKLFCYRCRDIDLDRFGDPIGAAHSGIKYLTKKEYEDQINGSNLGWECPHCGCTTCSFDNKYFELLVELPSELV